METALQTFQVTMPRQNAQTFTEMFTRMGWQVLSIPNIKKTRTSAETQRASFQRSFAQGYEQAVFGKGVRDARELLAELKNS